MPIVRCTCRIQLDTADLALDRKEHINRRCGGVEAGCKACEILRDLRAVQQAAVLGINAAIRAHWRADADHLDRFMLEHKRVPKGKEWETALSPETLLRAVVPGLPVGARDVVAPKIINSKGKLYTYHLVRAMAPILPSRVASSLANKALDVWQDARFDALVRQSISPPHFRATMPVPLPEQAVRLTRKEGDTYQLSFSLLPAREGRYALPIVARDDYMRAVLSELVGKKTKMGALQISQDRLRPGRWYVRIAYTRQVEKKKGTGVAIAVHLGLTRFLQVVSSTGATMSHEGHDIEAYLSQLQRRRRAYQSDGKASPRWGHGRARTLRPIKFLEGKGERWRDSKIQQLARHVADFAKKEGASVVYLPDFSGIRDTLPEQLKGGKTIWDRIQSWPYYRQQQAITSCLAEDGIATEVVPRQHTADTCPKCLHSDPNNIHLRRRLLICTECRHRELLDVAAGKNYLRTGEQLRTAKEAVKGTEGAEEKSDEAPSKPKKSKRSGGRGPKR